MAHYKDKEIYLGGSDVASLVLYGFDNNTGCRAEALQYGEDGTYLAYYVDDESVEIPEHYHLVTTFNIWLRIYDDGGRLTKIYADTIEIYRAGLRGTIIRAIGNAEVIGKVI